MFACVEFSHGLVLSIVLILGLGLPLGHGLVLSFVLGLGHPHGLTSIWN